MTSIKKIDQAIAQNELKILRVKKRIESLSQKTQIGKKRSRADKTMPKLVLAALCGFLLEQSTRKVRRPTGIKNKLLALNTLVLFPYLRSIAIKKVTDCYDQSNQETGAQTVH